MSSTLLAPGSEILSAALHLQILLAMMGLDVAMGLLLAFSTKQLNSSINWIGLTKKMAVILMIAACGVIDPLMPGNLTIGASIGYIGWEFLSITENAAMLGLPVPPQVKEALSKVREFTTFKRMRESGDQ